MILQQIGVGHTNSRLSGRSWFEDCGTAILANQSSGLLLDRVEFYDNLESIRAIDSYIHVRDGNAFHGGETGISIEGTFPGSTGIDIGDMGQGWNFFASNMQNGITCQGAEHPVGANIVNCRFSNVTNSATVFGGSNQYMYYNNTVENAPNGVFSFATGDNFNMTRCNEFANISNVDNLYLFSNQNTQFLENVSTGSHNVNYGFLSALMPENIGSNSNPAGNCFSNNGVDIVAESFFIFSQGNNFKYHFYDGLNAGPCQEPINSGNYTKVESVVQFEHCDGEIGIFNLIDPVGNGVKGFVPDNDNPPTCTYHIPKDSIRTNILHWIDKVVEEGGDDPRTPINEETSPPTPVRKDYEAVLDQWIRYAIYRGNDESDCAFVESILSPMVTFHWQKRRYGQKIMCGDIEGASYVLNSLQTEVPDIVAFKTIQNINLKRLRGLGDGNWISDTEISELKTISISEVPSSGYAKSLYRLLTGIKVPYDIPDMDDYKSNVSPRGILDRNTIAEEMRIFPNPATDKIYIGVDKELSRISISDINGRSIINYNNQNEIDVSGLADGLYIISLHFIDGTLINQKMVIN